MRLLAVVLGAVLLSTGCDQPALYECSMEIPEGMWHRDHVLECSFHMEDTVNLHDFFIDLRNGEGYPYQNIYLFLDLTFPNGKHALDTVECQLADPSGAWYGRGMGSRFFNRFQVPSKSRKAFPMPGEYHLSIEQAMREETLPGIHDAGFSLRKTP